MDEHRCREEIIESLFHEYGNQIYRYVKYTAPDDVDPADIVQEVFIRAFRYWDGFEGRAQPKNWLFRIARNYVFDVLRRKRHERRYLLDKQSDVSLRCVELDTVVELEDAIRRLNVTDRQVLNLRLIQDLSVRDTAEILGWTQMKVKTTYFRARQRLQNIIGEPMEDADSVQINDGSTSAPPLPRSQVGQQSQAQSRAEGGDSRG